MRQRRSFDNQLLVQLRNMEIIEALGQLGLYWKQDRDFQPVKDKSTKRLHVTVGSRVIELLVTRQKWYDVRSDRGGGGAIDLAMHLLNVDFVHAVRVLGKSDGRECGP